MSTYDAPSASQVSVSPPGSTSRYWLGQLGHVTGLSWSFVMPGGPDQLTATLEIPATYRTTWMNPGWTVATWRGGHRVWSGIMDEPQPTPSGWSLSATGTGALGANYVAYFTSTWPASQPDQSVNNAIGRGLPWTNPGIGQPAGMWFGQAPDNAADTITDLLNICCTRGGLTWYVNCHPSGLYGGNNIGVIPLPATADRLLISNTPVARTLGGYVNTIWLRYQVTAASSSTSGSQTSTYAVTSVTNQASIALYGAQEAYIDLSSAGVMTATQAKAVGNYVLAIYQAASFAGPFTVSPGQVTNLAGQPVDLGAEQAGRVYRLILCDYGYGGEVAPAPVTIIGGQYAWDDLTQIATITPYQVLNQSLSGLLSMETTILTPIQVQN